MPTTAQEVQKILEIVGRHIDKPTAQKIFAELYEEVGKTTENYSVRESLQAMAVTLGGPAPMRGSALLAMTGALEDTFRDLKKVQPPAPGEQSNRAHLELVNHTSQTLKGARNAAPVPPRDANALRFFLVLLVVAHLAVVLGNLAAFFVLPFYAPWYVALPLMSFVVWVTFVRIMCPLTKVENRLRRPLGLRPVKGFVGHYLFKPTAYALRLARRSRT